MDKNLINVKSTKVINWEIFVWVDFLFDLQTQNQNENIRKYGFQVNCFSDSRSVRRLSREKKAKLSIKANALFLNIYMAYFTILMPLLVSDNQATQNVVIFVL